MNKSGTHKKILISISTLEVGGAQNFALKLASILSENSQTEVYFFVWNGDKVETQMLNTLLSKKVRYYDLNRFHLINYLGWKLNALEESSGKSPSIRQKMIGLLFKYIIWKHRVDVVHSFLYPSDLNCAKHLHSSVPLVVTEEGDYLLRMRKGEEIDEIVIGRVNSWVAVSEFAKRRLASYLALDPKRIKLIYNGLPFVPVKNEEQKDKDSFVVGMVARGHQSKGWEALILAFLGAKKRVQRQMKLVLVGEGTFLDQLAKTYGDQEGIVFTGYSSNPGLYIAGFDIGVLPSFFEGETFGISVLEYLSNGKPVIVTDWGGLPEVMQDGEHHAGYVVGFHDDGKPNIGEIEDAIVKMASDPEVYADLRRNIDKVISRFDWKLISAEYQETYQKLI